MPRRPAFIPPATRPPRPSRQQGGARPASSAAPSPAAPPNPLDCFAVTAPGLEPLAAAELRALGIVAAAEVGGVAWRGDMRSLQRANLWLRTASRVLVRVASFRVRAFYELERHAKRVEWARWLGPDAAVQFRVTAKKSRLYHTDAVAERLGLAVSRAVPGARVVGGAPADADHDEETEGHAEGGAAPLLFVVRLSHDELTLSVDSSGALLHRRGYRQALARAPLRETLAAALLLAGEWDGTTPLLDPLCGSGTIPIEGALLARRIPPGLGRDFAFMRWPEFDAAAWARLLAEARAGILPAAPARIVGSDRDAGAIEAARANAERAGVAGDLTFTVAPVSAIPLPAEPRGLVATNPPYGVRVGDADRVRDLYAQLGQVLRARLPGWRLAMLSPDARLDREVRLPLAERVRTRNGGLPVRLLVGDIPE